MHKNVNYCLKALMTMVKDEFQYLKTELNH